MSAELNPEFPTSYALLGRDDESATWETLAIKRTQDEITDEFLSHIRADEVNYMMVLRLRAEVVSNFRRES